MPSPTRSPSTGVRPVRGNQQLRHQRESAHASRGQPVTHGGLVAAALAIAFPQQSRDALEAGHADKFLDGMAANDQPALLAIDLAHHRVGDDHAVEPAIHPCLQHRKSPCVFAAENRSAHMYCQY